jgi:biopolymer transport protein TolQ
VDILLNKYETFTDEFYSILHRQAHTSPVASSGEQPASPAAQAKG